MLHQKAHKQLEKSFRKFVKRDRKIENAYLLVHSDELDIHLKLAEGGKEDVTVHPDQPYYIANIHKLYTAVIVAMLEQEGKISYEDPISEYLDEELLQGLHVLKRFNYTSLIQVKHLLNHSSGLSDFLEDKPVNNGKPLIHKLLEERIEPITKEEVIEWSKENLTAHFPPGDGFHYSYTGYLLLSLIIEKITARPYYEVLHDYIIKPLNMDETYVFHHLEPALKSEHPLVKTYVHDVDVTKNNHIGFDDVSGRMVSTSENLLKLMKGLVNYQLLERDNLNRMAEWIQYPIGVDYGYGILKIKDTFGLMPQKYNAWGNIGLTGSFVFYHMELETYFIGTINTFRQHKDSIVLLKELVDIIYKYKK